jgi:hypothetical protein
MPLNEELVRVHMTSSLIRTRPGAESKMADTCLGAGHCCILGIPREASIAAAQPKVIGRPRVLGKVYEIRCA